MFEDGLIIINDAFIQVVVYLPATSNYVINKKDNQIHTDVNSICFAISTIGTGTGMAMEAKIVSLLGKKLIPLYIKTTKACYHLRQEWQ